MTTVKLDLPPDQGTLEARRRRSAVLMSSFPGKVPVYCRSGSADLVLEQERFLVTKEWTAAQFLIVLRQRIKEGSPGARDSLLLMTNHYLVPATSTFQELYDRYGDEDGFLYMSVRLENTFG